MYISNNISNLTVKFECKPKRNVIPKRLNVTKIHIILSNLIFSCGETNQI
ncbi:hypothetical protein CAMSH0001_1201 [Campylobacter showae RM3277]|uniref:Uncharacterized protein n=1 Tax=Campylobacter showae RM3277 TaxID=553219 RepID=C6RDP4_9BACT|nr:hypothetical protein CAMSH0001_1201 [Campylobacter showae RM3277]